MRLFVFGSTGDLFRRKVVWALNHIVGLEIIALGRKDLSHEEYFEETCPTCEEEIKSRTKYLPIIFGDTNIKCVGCEDYFYKEEINYFYVALPPEKIPETLNYIFSVKNKGYSVKILIEKPFGTSLDDAIKLKKLIEKNNLSDDAFLADHYLFKENIRKIKSQDFEKIEIASLEKVGVENRGFYDGVGAVNDMVQSHLLNVLAKIIDEKNLTNLKIDEVLFGQYKNYEKDIGKKSSTETYAKIKFFLGEREITIETGKDFPKKKNVINIDGKIVEMDGGKDPYLQMIEDFLENKKENFPSIEQAIISWKIMNEIKKSASEIEYY